MTRSPSPGTPRAGTMAPTGSIVVTGTMPDGHTWEVCNQAIPADATQPFVVTTTDQVLGTGASWYGGVLGQGLYKFQAKYVPAEGSLFYPGAQRLRAGHGDRAGWSDDFDSYALDRTSTARAAGRTSRSSGRPPSRSAALTLEAEVTRSSSPPRRSKATYASSVIRIRR